MGVQCKYCEKVCKTAQGLNGHMRIAHPREHSRALSTEHSRALGPEHSRALSTEHSRALGPEHSRALSTELKEEMYWDDMWEEILTERNLERERKRLRGKPIPQVCVDCGDVLRSEHIRFHDGLYWCKGCGAPISACER